MSPTLLITDDDAAMRETLHDVFATRGIATILASDGDEALDVLEREPVHVGLFDLQMPRVSGLQAIIRLRQLGLQTPCILMSAALDRDVIAQAEAHGVFSVLPKPFRCSELMRLVRDALHRYHGISVGSRG